jgi:O-methyltransferase
MDRLITQLSDFFSPASDRLKFQKKFIQRATGKGPDTVAFRKEIARRFRVIHRRVQCAHQEVEMLILAEAILNLQVPGPIVELGCFKGGSTTKLSLVAKATGRELHVFDSFEGLPSPEAKDAKHDYVSGKVKSYTQGEYRGTLDEVKQNISTWGEIGVCSFVKGYYSETLPKVNVSPAFVFMDVDLIDSGRTCMKALWPRLLPGGMYYTHEAGMATFLDGLLDGAWWHAELNCCPPLLVGAGFGHGPQAKHLGYFKKQGNGHPRG